MLLERPTSSPTPAAHLLAERVGAVRLPAAGHVRRRAAQPHGLDRDVVCVVTGDGIHDVLAQLDAGHLPARLVWAAPSPRLVHGDGLVDRVLAAVPGATVWDTARFGQPDLLRLAYAAYVSARASGVVCVSERTGPLVRALRSRGVPAYGPPRVV